MRRLIVALAVLVVAGTSVTLAVVFGSAGGSAEPAAAGTPHTVRTVLRPVHRDGTPAAGYTVTAESDPGFACDDGATPAAVDPDIRVCGYTALGTVSCWSSTGRTVLCLRDAYRHRLVRIRYTGTFAPVAAPKHPAPQGLTLSTGTRCHIRDGGAWDTVTGHPSWVGTYWCSPTTLYGPPAGYGIDTTTPRWRVHEVSGTSSNGSQRVTDRDVVRAYYVGTAA